MQIEESECVETSPVHVFFVVPGLKWLPTCLVCSEKPR